MTFKKHKIGIFGGSFDPIHNGHLISAQFVAEQLGLQKVIFLPTGASPLKSSHFSSPDDRLQMVKLAVQNNPLFEVSDYETKRKCVSYTTETLKHFCQLYIDSELVFIIGADSLATLHLWHNFMELPKLCEMVVVARPGYSASDDKMPFPIKIIPTPEIDISSTAIRNKLMQKIEIIYLVPTSVKDYIFVNKLYQQQ